MARMEISCRRFAMFGGMQTDPGAYAVCVQPKAPGLQKRGTLALITEPVGSVALEADACRLAQRAVVEGYFSDHSLGLTGSLLNALDGANNALLQYGSGWGGGDEGGAVAVKTRRVKVGMTALLVRADGTGVYLSQMAPTQAYILHNGLLTALPSPQGWDPVASRKVVSLKRVLTGETETEDDEDLGAADLANMVVPAVSLGSGPGIEADLIYRRVDAGDKIILVSSGLARQIDRQWAEEAFSYDADSIAEALAELAHERGLGEAHACVLELGVTVSSGVDTDYVTPVPARPSAQVAHEGGALAAPAPQGHEKTAPGAGLLDALRGPKDWFTKRKSEAESVVEAAPVEAEAPVEIAQQVWEGPLEVEAIEYVEEEAGGGEDGEHGEQWSKHPTQLFVQSAPEVPPYQLQAVSAAPESTEEQYEEELQFDGWEDSPPALDDPRYGSTHRVIFKPKLVEASAGEPFADMYGFDGANALDPVVEYAEPPALTALPGRKAKSSGFDFREAGPKVLGWLGHTFAAIIPQRAAGAAKGGSGAAGKKMLLPLRAVILAVVAILGVVLVFSLISGRGNAEKEVTNSLLAEAQALQTAANQAGISEAEKIEKLQLALDKAKEAAAEDPASLEAQRLLTKLSGDLDRAQGVTRLASLKLLFDLDVIDNAAEAPATGQGPVDTASENDVLVQGNEVYVLDRAKNRIYRCQIAAKSCSAVLSAGDAVGGKTMGSPIAMTMRVGSPVVLDDRLVSYIFTADSGSWAAERLGGADALQRPLGIASYDGNLYLIGSKPGQVLKYPAGQYGSTPIDWVIDGATSESLRDPAAMAIDGTIFVVLKDGRVVAMQGGKTTGMFTPKAAPGASAPTELFTNTDIRDLYVLRASDGSIVRLSKEGETLGTYKAPSTSELSGFAGIAVDEGKGKIYMAFNRKVYEAALPGTGAKSAPPVEEGPAAQSEQPVQQEQAPADDKPSVKPTVEP